MSLTTVDSGLISSGAITLTTQVTGTLPVANGGSGVTTSTGTGANVLGTSPTLATPTFDSASLVTISGTAPLYMCRAWVNFNGTGTVAIRASGNMSSITDNGTGDYTVNFTTAISDANYSTVGSCIFNGGSVGSIVTPATTAGTPTTSTMRFSVRSSVSAAVQDYEGINIAIFR